MTPISVDQPKEQQALQALLFRFEIKKRTVVLRKNVTKTE
jgi:hypothetical protein